MYEGVYSINFGVGDGKPGVNTWNDWHLIPTSKPVVPLPNPQHKFVEIPGRHGSLDISDYLTKDLIFSDRSGSFEFIVDNDHEDWKTIYGSIAKYLHGKKLWMVLTDEPEWSYYGRFTATWTPGAPNSKVVITYRVDPFKYSKYDIFTDNIEWDDYNFETGVNYDDYSNITVKIGQNVGRYVTTTGHSGWLVAKMIEGPGPVCVTLNNSMDTQVWIDSSQIGQTFNVGMMSQFGQHPVTIGCRAGEGPAKVSLGWKKESL